jgi:hypothetical protein
MASRRASRLRNTVNMNQSVTPANPVPPAQVDPLDAIKAKFNRLSELATQIASAKTLYEEYDNLLEELVPCFITKTDTGFNVKSQITIGEKVYRLHPTFFNVQKNRVVAKNWKSAAFPTVFIEG